MAASMEGLVPITRVFLARYYRKYPMPRPLHDDVLRLTAELQDLSDHLDKEFPLTSGEELLAKEVELQLPNIIDENLWKNRDHTEEIILLLKNSHRPGSSVTDLHSHLEIVVTNPSSEQ